MSTWEKQSYFKTWIGLWIYILSGPSWALISCVGFYCYLHRKYIFQEFKHGNHVHIHILINVCACEYTQPRSLHCLKTPLRFKEVKNQPKIKIKNTKSTRDVGGSVYGTKGESQLVCWPFKRYQGIRLKAINPTVFTPLPTLTASITKISPRWKRVSTRVSASPGTLLPSPPAAPPTAAKRKPKEKY